MNLYRIATTFILIGSLTTACKKDLLEQTNPNAPSTSTFWKNSNDAVQGVNAAYSNMQDRTISLWELFSNDARSDEGYSQSPWTDLGNVTRFIINDYNIPMNIEFYQTLYRGIYRCNQVLTYVPSINMDANLKKRLLAEAKFIRGHFYYKLVTHWGAVPIVTSLQSATDRPDQATEQQVWDQVIKDFSDAKADLPASYTGNDIGRATKGSATGYLARSYLQQKKWTECAAQCKEIIDNPAYGLMDDYKMNFMDETVSGSENNKESIFEIQYRYEAKSGFPNYDVAGGSESSERAQFFGVRGIGWCDSQPTRWLLLEMMKEKNADGEIDPRLQYTLTYKHSFTLPNGTPLPKSVDVNTLVATPSGANTIYSEKLYTDPATNKPLTYDDRIALGNVFSNDLFWRKYTNWWKPTDTYFSGINTRVIRLADVYLMYAEALNELGSTSLAIPYANLVRQRPSVNMNPLSLAMSQSDFRTQLQHDRVVELGGESVRLWDMKRYGILSTALAGPQPYATDPRDSDFDLDFKNYIPGKERNPIPLYETDANTKVKQRNPAW